MRAGIQAVNVILGIGFLGAGAFFLNQGFELRAVEQQPDEWPVAMGFGAILASVGGTSSLPREAPADRRIKEQRGGWTTLFWGMFVLTGFFAWQVGRSFMTQNGGGHPARHE